MVIKNVYKNGKEIVPFECDVIDQADVCEADFIWHDDHENGGKVYIKNIEKRLDIYKEISSSLLDNTVLRNVFLLQYSEFFNLQVVIL